ncbi:hypothetical protein J2X76_003959 [Neorhizobium sp. 2083]|uniref:hypothetical protein n=1 Tax=Neorhizobium sp. 2083 TaxID=2817762 RepID=UPI00286725D9|nr:hypothetical protein [Neorhizobium sp. 2083]MDR6818777.1 hypothetical protein [Neorhizobium sp. 2083]
MTYSIDYSAYFGPSFIERGCRAEIVVELNAAGAVTGISSYSWSRYIGSPTCTVLDLEIDNTGAVDWKVEFYAPNT